MVATSKHLRSTTELTLVADIKPGFVEITEPFTYASRLKLLLGALFDNRQQGVERDSSSYVGPLERLGSLHFVRWNVFDDDQRLLLAVSFDRPWEPYIRLIVDRAGPILDVIFSHCDDYDGFACWDGYPKFAQWVRKHQIESNFFYAVAPETSVDDARYLKEVEQLTRTALTGDAIKARVADYHVPELKVKPQEGERRASVIKLARLGEFFPPRNSGNSLTDREFFDRAAKALLGGLEEGDPFDPPRVEPPRGVDAIELYRNGALDGVQGGVLKGYGGATHGCLALVQFPTAEAGARFLSRMAEAVTTLGASGNGPRTNVALTFRGLEKLQLQHFQLAQFPKEFQEGMEARAGFLGDVGRAHPDRWDLPKHVDAALGHVPLATVDAVVLLQMKSNGAPVYEWSEDHPLWEPLARATEGVDVLHVQPVYRVVETVDGKLVMRDHFGFADGMSQPRPLDENASERDRVPLGEMVLGYPNARGETTAYRNVRGQADPENDFFKDGTFLVIRKLEQRVDEFDQYLKKHGNGNERLLAAKLMGRDRDGNVFDGDTDNLVSTPRNDFDFEKDPHGHGCPFRAHIRRANPRDSVKTVDDHELHPPRIARRGFAYRSADDDGERGLMFLAYCASIADQYEVIQRWINGGNSTGVLSAHNDVVMAHSDWNRDDEETYRIHVNHKPEELPRTDPFITLKWGMYLFVPSKEGLERIAKLATQVPETALATDSLVAAGEQVIAQLERIGSRDEHRARQEWKKILEDRNFIRHRTAVWAAIRERGGAMRTPYGVLVGSAALVREVLTNEEHYSAREYWHRMDETLGIAYLGMDRHPRPIAGTPSSRDARYEREVTEGLYVDVSTEPNEFISGITREQAFDLACSGAKAIIGSQPGMGNRKVIDLRALAQEVTAAASKEWFGLPDGEHMGKSSFEISGERKAKCPFDFITSSRYIFYPNPGGWVGTAARKSGRLIADAVNAFVGKNRPPKGTLLEVLKKKSYMNKESQWQERAVATAVSGFMAATIGSFLSVMAQWMRSAELWRHQQRVLTDEAAAGPRGFLAEEMIRAMRRAPFPDLLYRTAVQEKELYGKSPHRVSVQPGERVVVSLASASAELPETSDELLFGGYWKDEASGTVHPCPGRELALGVMLGMIHTVLGMKDLREESPLVLSGVVS